MADVFNRSTPRADDDTPTKLDRRTLKLPVNPQRVGGRPLSDHQSSQVLAAIRLDELLPADKRILGTTTEFRTQQDVWTEQRARAFIRLVSLRARAHFNEDAP